jgi:hypothetical protein
MEIHNKILIGTVVNKLKKAKLTGNLCMMELYFMDIINEFIYECNNFCLNKCQTDKLELLYRNLQNSNSYICKIRNKPKTHFFKSANININNFFGEMATFNININEQINLPPTEVGDGSTTTAHAVTYIFDRIDFTTKTTPPYSDPEGDAAKLLKVISIPSGGELKLNNVNVVSNQIIDFDDIDASLLTYEPDPSALTTRVENFTFAIADEGSLTFVS